MKILHLVVFIIFIASSLPLHAGGKAFRVMDATAYSGKPPLERFGLEPMRVLVASFLWEHEEARGDLPSQADLTRVSEQISGESEVILDVEHWPLDDAHRGVNLSRYADLVDDLARRNPGVRFGYYGRLPHRDYWAPIEGGARRVAWRRYNDANRALADHVDALYPSLYTFDNDFDEWEVFARAQIAESRRLAPDKPVYAFLWPQYHDSVWFRGLDYLPRGAWRRQLEVAHEVADGIVIWGGWDFDAWQPAKWDEQAPWWLETKDFLVEKAFESGLAGEGPPKGSSQE